MSHRSSHDNNVGLARQDRPADVGADPRSSWPLRTVEALVVLVLAGLAVAGALAPYTAALGLGVRQALAAWEQLPSDLIAEPLPQRSVILAADGSPVGQFFSENRIIVPLAEVPQVMRDALISVEDARFYEHTGVDFRGTLRAFAHNSGGASTQGGSTLTQQYVKNVLLQQAGTAQEREQVVGRSYGRKLREARYSFALEASHPKDQILEGYFNIAYFGDGAYGIGTAAQHYFGKAPKDLTLPEAALLAGLVQNPTGYDPVAHPQEAQTRRDVVLSQMLKVGKITPEQAAQAAASPVALTVTDPPNGCTGSPYPFFCQWVRDILQDDPAFGATPAERRDRLFRGGMTIRTTLDPKAQRLADAAVRKAAPTTSRIGVASVTMQPGTGAVTALGVNREFGTGPGRTQVLLPLVPAYQPGSTMKPITLATALEQGFDLSTIMNAPNRFTPPSRNSPPGGFGNSGDSEAGDYDTAQAMWRSVNTWFVELQQRTGVLPVADMAARLGITSLPRTGPRAITERDASLTLGTYEVSPVEMTAAYATFAAHGVSCAPIAITSVTGADGRPVPVPDARCHQALAPAIADTITSVLRGVVDGPDPLRTGLAASIGRPVAGKTGTTNGSAAAWFDGYTPQYATSVWVGDPAGGPSHPLQGVTIGGRYLQDAYGGTAAAPVWHDIMAPLQADLPVQDFTPSDPAAAGQLVTVVPSVRGLHRDKAVQVLQDAGYTVRISPTNAPSDALLRPDHAAATDPAPGSRAPAGSPVVLTLTDGSDTAVTVPDPQAAPAAPAVPAPGNYDAGGGIITTPTPTSPPAAPPGPTPNR